MKYNKLKKVDYSNLRTENVGVKEIPTDSLKANPHNPRRLFDQEPLKELEDSIRKVGILVPLTVYWSPKDTCFVILDGQRRWICAQNINIKTVPVNQVAEPTLVQNIVTMFQIHNNREPWELMPTALKLEVLMKELNERNEKKLAILTGLTPTHVSRCKKLLSYSPKYQDLMLDPNPSQRIRADFFILLHSVLIDRSVRKMHWFSKDEFIDRMFFKYQNKKGINRVTDFRLIKEYIHNARNAGKDSEIEKRLKEFTYNDELKLDHLEIEEADLSASLKKTVTDLQKIETSIKEINSDEYFGEEELWDTLERLFKLIRQKLQDAGRGIK